MTDAQKIAALQQQLALLIEYLAVAADDGAYNAELDRAEEVLDSTLTK